MRAALYARVSSERQREAHTIEAQLHALPEFARARGWTIVGAPYIDDGRTAKAGHLDGRAGLCRLLADIERTPRPFDVVIVFDLDRLTRSEDIDERGRILGAFQRAGVAIATCTTGQVLDLATSTGDLLAALGGYFAADWLRKHRERIKAGKERAIAAGKKPAGPTPFGLRYARATGAWSFDEPAADVVREAFRRVAAGESCEEVAIDFERRGVARARASGWTRHAVWRLVRSEVYRGRFVVDKATERAIAVPALVDDELWFAAERALLANGKRGLRKTKHVYLLEGIAFCALCGSAICINSARQREGQVGYYICASRRRGPRRGTRCPLPMVRTTDVDAEVWRNMAEILSTPDRLGTVLAHQRAGAAHEGQDWAADLRGYEQRLAQLARVEEAVLERFRRGLIAEGAMDRHLEASARERAALERQVDAARRAMASAASAGRRIDGVIASLVTLRERMEGASPQHRREMVHLLVGTGRVVELAPKEARMTMRLRIGLAVASGSSLDREANGDDGVDIAVVSAFGGRR